MRSGSPIAAVLIVGALLGACASAPPDSRAGVQGEPAGDTTVRVEFLEPERFTDIQTAPGNDRQRDANLAELRRHVELRAAPLLANGQRLEVTITDVDMAGQAEPWRTRAPEMRIVRDVYPPRIDLRFRLTDGAGTVLRSGELSLRDPMFMARTGGYASDRLRYEKALLDDWMEREFGAARRG